MSDKPASNEAKVYRIWTLWPNDFDWVLQKGNFSPEEAKLRELPLRLSGYDVKILPEGKRPPKVVHSGI